MFKKLLVGLGIGAAGVNLEVAQRSVELGGLLKGTVRISGGSLEQQVEQIVISLILTSEYKHDDQIRGIKQEIGSVRVAEGFTIKANSPEVTIPVELSIPFDIPVSKGRTRYHLETSLDIKNAVDPTDKDAIVITPNRYVQALFDALQGLGFRDKAGSGDFNGRVQKFEYVPTRFMAGKLDEIELFLSVHANGLEIFMQIDKRSRGIFGALADELDLDERHVRFTLPYSGMGSAEQVAESLKRIIETEYAKIDF